MEIIQRGLETVMEDCSVIGVGLKYQMLYGFGRKKMIKKCPTCQSMKLRKNDDNEVRCDNCGFENSSSKKACFVEFSEFNSLTMD